MDMNLDIFSLSSKTLGNTRKVRVLYPKDKSKRYPVLYVHDGEFCFRRDTPEDYECMSLDLALEKSGQEMIIVTLEAMPWQIRTREYSPFPWVGEAEQFLINGQELGNVYLEWLINEVKPLIDAKYLTKSDYENTFMLGCSLGGLISLYASAKYPDTFSKIGTFSLASWGNQTALLEYLNAHPLNKKTSLFMRVGTKEGTPRNLESLKDCYVAVNLEVRNHLINMGVKNLNFKVNEGGVHKTAEWEKDMPEFIDWLFK